MRSDLTPTEAAEHLARRKELWGILGGNLFPPRSRRTLSNVEPGGNDAGPFIKADKGSAPTRLADEYDAAQERGEVAGHGRSKLEADELTTASDIGLRHDQIHEARQIRDAGRTGRCLSCSARFTILKRERLVARTSTTG